MNTRLWYILGLLEVLSGSVHEDIEHYREGAKRAATILREVLEGEEKVPA